MASPKFYASELGGYRDDDDRSADHSVSGAGLVKLAESSPFSEFHLIRDFDQLDSSQGTESLQIVLHVALTLIKPG